MYEILTNLLHGRELVAVTYNHSELDIQLEAEFLIIINIVSLGDTFNILYAALCAVHRIHKTGDKIKV